MNMPVKALLAETYLNDEPAREWPRWGLAFGIVLSAHLSLAGILMLYRSEPAPDVGTGAPMVVELANFMSAPPAGNPAPSAPPEPEPTVQPEPPPPPPEPKVVQPQPKPEPPPKPPKPEIAERPPEPRPPKPETRPPENQSRPGPSSNTPATSQLSSTTAQQEASRIASLQASWQGRVNAHLERHKRYPHQARSRREEGTARLHFKMDRRGHILSSSLEPGTGYFLLDREAQAVLRRAQPLPEPPPDVRGEVLELVWEVEFKITR